jgi:hypothetical protein
VSKVLLAVSGSYGRSGAAYLVRRAVSPLISVTVAPGRSNGCVSLEAQSVVRGSWRTTSALACLPLDFWSKGSVSFVTNGLPGKTRVRAFVASGAFSGAGSTPWIYITFT